MIEIGPIHQNGYSSQFVSYRCHQNYQKSFAEQVSLLKNRGDIIVSVGEESMQGKPFSKVLKAISRAKSVLELKLINIAQWAENHHIVRPPAELPVNEHIPLEFHWIEKDTKYNVLDGMVEHPAKAISLPYYFENNWVVDIIWLTTPERKNQKVLCSKVMKKIFTVHERPVTAGNISKQCVGTTFGHRRHRTCKWNARVEYSSNYQSQAQTDMHKKPSAKRRKIPKTNEEETDKVKGRGEYSNNTIKSDAPSKEQTDMHKKPSGKRRKIAERNEEKATGSAWLEEYVIHEIEEYSRKTIPQDYIMKKEEEKSCNQDAFRCPINASRRGCDSSSNKVRLPCNHEFCRPCMYKLLKNEKDVITYDLIGQPVQKFSIKTRCPICKQLYSPRTISHLLGENQAIDIDTFK